MFTAAGLTTVAQAPVANFKATNVATGSAVSLADYANQNGVVLLFTSNDCPFDAYYHTRIKTLIETYQGKINFVLINSYLEPEESEEAMKAAYANWKITVPYLADKEQAALRALGARKSPEAFVLKSSKAGMVIFYSGAIDDSPQTAAGVDESYLKNAIDALLAGAAPVSPSRAVGCTIRR